MPIIQVWCVSVVVVRLFDLRVRLRSCVLDKLYSMYGFQRNQGDVYMLANSVYRCWYGSVGQDKLYSMYGFTRTLDPVRSVLGDQLRRMQYPYARGHVVRCSTCTEYACVGIGRQYVGLKHACVRSFAMWEAVLYSIYSLRYDIYTAAEVHRAQARRPYLWCSAPFRLMPTLIRITFTKNAWNKSTRRKREQTQQIITSRPM